ncbi:MAG: hypothetical protein ACTHQQ_16340 [Solirubrobacteraceae bacterium]
MPDQSSPALRVALAYYDTWTNKDLERAMSYVSEDIVCEALVFDRSPFEAARRGTT